MLRKVSFDLSFINNNNSTENDDPEMFEIFEQSLSISDINSLSSSQISSTIANSSYSNFTWRACSSILSRYLLENQAELVANKNVLELGCGTGLCGLICAKLCNANQVTMTDATLDYSHIEASIDHHQLDRNKCRAFAWRWATFSKKIIDYFNENRIDLIIASDCFYDNEGKVWV
jgi:predicted nicotinamide N-methyase